MKYRLIVRASPSAEVKLQIAQTNSNGLFDTTNQIYVSDVQQKNSIRPKRAAAVQGEQDRRDAASASAALGKQLREAMGTSDGYYSTTKSGSTRLEYLGR